MRARPPLPADADRACTSTLRRLGCARLWLSDHKHGVTERPACRRTVCQAGQEAAWEKVLERLRVFQFAVTLRLGDQRQAGFQEDRLLTGADDFDFVSLSIFEEGRRP